MRGRKETGQVLVAVLVVLLIAATLVPLMVFYSQREATWTAKQAKTTTAFHLAEAGIEKGYLELSLSTQTWVNLQKGTLPTNYHFDKEYTDLSGGTYAISITSGPKSQQATIISVGRDALHRQVRAIKAVYSNSPLGGVAIYSGAGAYVSNKVTVEWGAVVSPNNISLSGVAVSNYPQIWTAGSIDAFDTNPTPPNCDSPSCCQWHTYQKNLPPQPILDLPGYKSAAQGHSGCIHGNPANANPYYCYFGNDVEFKNASDTSGATYYIDGSLSINSPGIDIVGQLIVMKDLSTASGNWGNGNHTMSMPTDAWKQYCANWSHYTNTYDSLAPATFPGLNATYQGPSACSPTTACSDNKLGVAGLLYVGGNFSIGGGNGGSDIYGVMYVVGSTTMTANSSVTLYYDQSAANNLQLSQILLSRTSWQDYLYPWPSNL